MKQVLVLSLLVVTLAEATTLVESPVAIDQTSFHDDDTLVHDGNTSDHHALPEVPAGSQEHPHKVVADYPQQDNTHPSAVYRAMNESPEMYNYPEHPSPDYTKESDDYDEEFDLKFQREEHYPRDSYEGHGYHSMVDGSSAEDRNHDGANTHHRRKYWRYDGLQGHSEEQGNHHPHSGHHYHHQHHGSSEESHEDRTSESSSSEESSSDEHRNNENESNENGSFESESHESESYESDSHDGESHESHTEESYSEEGNSETGSNTESDSDESDSDESDSNESDGDESDSDEHHARYTHYHSHNHHDKDEDVHKMLHHHFHLIIPKHHVEDLFSHEDPDNKPLLGFQFFDKEHRNMVDRSSKEDDIDDDHQDSSASDSSEHESQSDSESNEEDSSEEFRHSHFSHMPHHSSEEASFGGYHHQRYDSHERSSEESDSGSDENSRSQSHEHSDKDSEDESDDYSDEESDEHYHRGHIHYGQHSDESSEEASSEEYPDYSPHFGSHTEHRDYPLHDDYHHSHHERHPHYQRAHSHDDHLGRSHHVSHHGWRDEVFGDHEVVPIYKSHHHRHHYPEDSENEEETNESDESSEEIHSSRFGHSYDHGERKHHGKEHWGSKSGEDSGSVERVHHAGHRGHHFHKHGDWEHRRHNSHHHGGYHYDGLHAGEDHHAHHYDGLHAGEDHHAHSGRHHARNFRFSESLENAVSEENSPEEFDRTRHSKLGRFETRQFQDWHRSKPVGHPGRTFHHDFNEEDSAHGFSHRGSHKIGIGRGSIAQGLHRRLLKDLDIKHLGSHRPRYLHLDRQGTSSPGPIDGEHTEKLPDIIPSEDQLTEDHQEGSYDNEKAEDGLQDHPHEDHSTEKVDVHDETSLDRALNVDGTDTEYRQRHHVGRFGGQLLGPKHDYVDVHPLPFRSRLVGHSYHPHKIVSYGGRPHYPKYQF